MMEIIQLNNQYFIRMSDVREVFKVSADQFMNFVNRYQWSKKYLEHEKVGTETFVSCKSVLHFVSWYLDNYSSADVNDFKHAIAKYAKKCAEFGVKPNSAEYLTGYDQGVFKYCTYQQGYELGENGSDYNQVCSGPLAADFAPGYDEGRAVYEIYEEHKSLISGAGDTHAALIEVRRKLKEDELAEGDRRRLEKKRRRLKEDRDDARIDVRAFERIHGLPRHRFD